MRKNTENTISLRGMLILLDIDGVMVPAHSWKAPPLLADGFPAFSAPSVTALNTLLTPDTTLVITSSHKSKYNLHEWKGIFDRRGINTTQLTCLPDNETYLSRKAELERWHSLNNITLPFVIIDDDTQLHALPPVLKQRLIITEPLVGLTESHVKQVRNILGSSL